MQETIKIFENEVQDLLKDYFSDSELFKLFDQADSSKHTNQFDKKIDELYKKQLDISLDEASERIFLDRTLTIAEKKLASEKFCALAVELGNICIYSGKINFAQEIFNKIIKKTGNTLYKAKALMGLSDIYSRKANWTRSIMLATEAESIYKELEDKTGVANCYNLLGAISGEMGEISQAKDYFSQSLLAADELNNTELHAKVETNLGVINSILGNTEKAIEHLEAAMNVYREQNDIRRQSESYLNIGLNYLQSSDLKSADEAFNKGISIALDNQFLIPLAMLYLAKAQLLLKTKDLFHAELFADKALSLSHLLDDKLTVADIYRIRGVIAREKLEYQTAESYLMIGLRINTKQRNALNIAECSFELGILYKAQLKNEQSNLYFNQAVDYFTRCKAEDKIIKIKNLMNQPSNTVISVEVNDGK